MPDSVAQMVQREKVRQMVAAEKARRVGAPAPAALSAKPKPRVGFYPATPEETAAATAFLDKPPVPGMTLGSRMKQEWSAYDQEVGGQAKMADEAMSNLARGEILHDPIGAVRDVGRVAGAVISPVTALANRVLQPGGSETERKIMWGLRTPLDAPGAAIHDLSPALGEKGAEALVSGVMLAAPFAKGLAKGGLESIRRVGKGAVPDISKPPTFDIPEARAEPALPRAMPEKPAPTPSLRAGDRPIPPAELAALGDEAWQGVEPAPSPAKPAEAPPSPPPASGQAPAAPSAPVRDLAPERGGIGAHRGYDANVNEAMQIANRIVGSGDRAPRQSADIVRDLANSPHLSPATKNALQSVVALTQESRGAPTRMNAGEIAGHGDRLAAGQYTQGRIELSGPAIERSISRQLAKGRSHEAAAHRALATLVAHEHVHSMTSDVLKFVEDVAESTQARQWSVERPRDTAILGARDTAGSGYRTAESAVSGVVKVLNEFRRQRGGASAYDKATDYAAWKPGEFVAEALSNPKVQEALAKMKSIGRSGGTLWTDLKAAVARILEHFGVRDARTLLDDAMEAVQDLKLAQSDLQSRGAIDPSRAPAYAPDVPAAPPRGPTMGAGAPPSETPPAGPTLGAQSPKRPLTPGDARGAIRTQLSEKIDNLKGYSPDLFFKVKEALSLKSARTAKPVRDLQQALKNLTPEEAQGLTPAIMERRAQGTPAQNAFAEWWQNEHPKIREHLKSVGSRVVEKRDLADLPETIPPDWNLKEIGPGKYLVTRPINAVPDFFPMRMSEVARDALKAGDPVVTEAIYGEGIKQGAWKDKAGFDQYLETYEAPNLKSTAAGLERPRKFRVPDEYREPDVVKTLNRYMHDVGQTSSEQSVFRYFDEKTGEARNPNETWAPQGDLGDILGRLDPTERHAAERLSLDLLGRNPEGWAEQNRKSIEFSNRVGAVNALRLYGVRPTTAIVQLTQTAMTNSLVGTKATAKAVARFVMNPRAVYEEAVRSGAVRPHSQYADTIGVREQGAKGGGVLNAASDLAMKPMAMTDLAGRLIASATAPDFAAQVGKQLQGNAWSKRIAMKNLEALDYAPADAAQFIKGLTPEQMDILRQRIVERTQGEVTNASRIPAATTPVGRVIMQGKNFGIAQARNTWRVAGKQLFQAGNPIPAAKLVVGAYLAGKGIAAAKDFLVGPSEKTRPDDELTALHEGSLGGYVGDVTYSAIRGKAQLSETLDRISDSQFAGLIAAVARAGYDVTDPPTDRKIATGQGPPIDIKKSRIDVLLNALQNAAPTGKEWVRIYDHFVGDDSIRKHEANAKALRELRKAQQGATLGAGAR